MGLFSLMLGGAVAGKVAGNTMYKKQLKQARTDENLALIAATLFGAKEKRMKERERAQKIVELNQQLSEIGARLLPETANEEEIQQVEIKLDSSIYLDIEDYTRYLDKLSAQLRNYRHLVREQAKKHQPYPDFEAYQQKFPVDIRRHWFDRNFFDLEAGMQTVLQKHYREEFEEFMQADFWDQIGSDPKYYNFPGEWLDDGPDVKH